MAKKENDNIVTTVVPVAKNGVSSDEPTDKDITEEEWTELAQLAADAIESIDRFRKQVEDYCLQNQMPGELEDTMANFASLRQAVIHSKMMRTFQADLDGTGHKPSRHTKSKQNPYGDSESSEYFEVTNPHIHRQREAGISDFLYHLGVTLSTDQSPRAYRDIQGKAWGNEPKKLHLETQLKMEVFSSRKDVTIPKGTAEEIGKGWGHTPTRQIFAKPQTLVMVYGGVMHGFDILPAKAAFQCSRIFMFSKGETPTLMYDFATYCLDLLKINAPFGLGVADLCGPGACYVMYKVGPVLIASHGMGHASVTTLLNEIFKLLHYGQAKKDVRFIRIGTCGGVGVRPGTTVISQHVYNGLFQNCYEQVHEPHFFEASVHFGLPLDAGHELRQFTSGTLHSNGVIVLCGCRLALRVPSARHDISQNFQDNSHILGHVVLRPAVLDQDMCQDLLYHGSNINLRFPVVVGNTFCTNGYFEQQARLDGAFCDYSHLERMKFLQDCEKMYAIRSMDMESLAFAALTHFAGVKGAVVTVALQNVLVDEKVASHVADSNLEEWLQYPQRLVGEYIKAELRKTLEKTTKSILASEREAHRLTVATKGKSVTGKKSGKNPGKLEEHVEPMSVDLVRLKIMQEELDTVAATVRGSKKGFSL